MAAAPPRLLTKQTAWNCVLVNQLATPGLGSFYAGHRIAGSAQMILALAGFGLMMVWSFWFFATLLRTLQVPGTSPQHALGILGVVLFALSWLWSLITSVQILRQLRRSGAPI